MGARMVPDERDFRIIETARSPSHLYYRVLADGIPLDCVLRVSDGQRSRTLDYELMMWCKFNAALLTGSRIVHADLDSVREASPDSAQPAPSASTTFASDKRRTGGS